jgi:hypothetical protein
MSSPKDVRIWKGTRVKSTQAGLRRHWREVSGTFLKLGALSHTTSGRAGGLR